MMVEKTQDRYQKLGFKCGLEFHQELETGKLFCPCSSALTEGAETRAVVRKLRAVAGELGQVDPAAQYEMFRDREFHYHLYEGEACLVELDEEPPHQINPRAFHVGLVVARMFGLKVPDELFVMRKSVVDGSNTSGFQRTCQIGIQTEGSVLETTKVPVRIESLFIEEEAAKIDNKRSKGRTRHFSLSRLSIPLVELGTCPDIVDPEHAREVAETIGLMLRATGAMKRGIGTIRQDVNISIFGGARIEVKGWQDLRSLSKLVENETTRQESLLKLMDELKAAGLDKIPGDVLDVTETFANVKTKFLAKLIKDGGRVVATRLPGFDGRLKKEVCTGRTLGRELADYAVAVGVGGIIHSDEDLKKYGLVKEFSTLRSSLSASESDLVLIAAGPDVVARKAVDAVVERARYLLVGIPEETRAPNYDDATTSYARPLPGAKRMYPETDLPPLAVTELMLQEAEDDLPETPVQRKKRYLGIGLSDDLAGQLIRSRHMFLFDKAVERFDINPTVAASILTTIVVEVRRKDGVDTDEIDEDGFMELFDMLAEGKLAKEAIPRALVCLAKGEPIEVENVSGGELDTIVDRIFTEKAGIIEAKGERAFAPLMGLAMKEVRGKVDGKLVAQAIRQRLQAALKG